MKSRNYDRLYKTYRKALSTNAYKTDGYIEEPLSKTSFKAVYEKIYEDETKLGKRHNNTLQNLIRAQKNPLSKAQVDSLRRVMSEEMGGDEEFVKFVKGQGLSMKELRTTKGFGIYDERAQASSLLYEELRGAGLSSKAASAAVASQLWGSD